MIGENRRGNQNHRLDQSEIQAKSPVEKILNQSFPEVFIIFTIRGRLMYECMEVVNLNCGGIGLQQDYKEVIRSHQSRGICSLIDVSGA